MRSILIGSALAIFIVGTVSSQEWQPKRTPDGQPDISGIIWTTGPDESRTPETSRPASPTRSGARYRAAVHQGRQPDHRSAERPDSVPAVGCGETRADPARPSAPEIGRTVVNRDPAKLREVRPQYMCLPAAPRINFDRDFQMSRPGT